MRLKILRLLSTAVGAAALFATAGANANLLYLSADKDPFTGSGLGSVSTVLTLASPGSKTTATGSVFAVGTGFDADGDALEGASQVGLPSLGALGITNIGDLRIVLNAAEPAGNSITISSLALSFYGVTGITLGTFSLAAPVTFASTLTATGQAGFAFGFDAEQAAAASSLLGGGLANMRIGLAATLSDTTGGPDTFFVSSVSSAPEPETYALMLAGLGVIGFMTRRRLR